MEPQLKSGNWTHKDVHLLIKCWLNNETAREIGVKLTRSRNSVIAKAKRLNLPKKSNSVIATSIAREGQGKFRKIVLEAYNQRCCVTGCEEISVLEAAHIVPYASSTNHNITNGICLRSDIHSLFDCNLIQIQPDFEITVSTNVTDPDYLILNGLDIFVPSQVSKFDLSKNLAKRLELMANTER